MSASHLKAALLGGLLVLYLLVIEGVSYVLKWRWSALHGDPARRSALRRLGDPGHGPLRGA